MLTAGEYPPLTLSSKEHDLAVKSVLEDQGLGTVGCMSTHRRFVSGADGNEGRRIRLTVLSFEVEQNRHGYTGGASE